MDSDAVWRKIAELTGDLPEPKTGDAGPFLRAIEDVVSESERTLVTGEVTPWDARSRGDGRSSRPPGYRLGQMRRAAEGPRPRSGR